MPKFIYRCEEGRVRGCEVFCGKIEGMSKYKYPLWSQKFISTGHGAISKYWWEEK